MASRRARPRRYQVLGSSCSARARSSNEMRASECALPFSTARRTKARARAVLTQSKSGFSALARSACFRATSACGASAARRHQALACFGYCFVNVSAAAAQASTSPLVKSASQAANCSRASLIVVYPCLVARRRPRLAKLKLCAGCSNPATGAPDRSLRPGGGSCTRKQQQAHELLALACQSSSKE